MIARLELAIKFKVEFNSVYSFALIVNQVNGNYIVANSFMASYFEKVKKLTKEFKKIDVKQFPRKHNWHVNALANITSLEANYLDRALIRNKHRKGRK